VGSLSSRRYSTIAVNFRRPCHLISPQYTLYRRQYDTIQQNLQPGLQKTRGISSSVRVSNTVLSTVGSRYNNRNSRTSTKLRTLLANRKLITDCQLYTPSLRTCSDRLIGRFGPSVSSRMHEINCEHFLLGKHISDPVSDGPLTFYFCLSSWHVYFIRNRVAMFLGHCRKRPYNTENPKLIQARLI
jgi:hypothetical protein